MDIECEAGRVEEAPKGSKQVMMLLNLGRKRKLWVNYISTRFGNSGEKLCGHAHPVLETNSGSSEER